MPTERSKKLQWDPSYSVGVPLLDQQHKQIFDLVNRLSGAEMLVGSEDIAELLTLLTRYADTHFKSEEQLLAKHDYPLLQEHIAEHLEFRERVAELCVQTMDKNEAVPQELNRFVADWLKHHLLKTDMLYKAFLEEQGLL